MLTSFMTDTYFTKIQKGLETEFVIDGPVHMTSDNSDEIVGHIEWYNKKTGHIRVKLLQRMYYKHLMDHGILQKDIVFNN